MGITPFNLACSSIHPGINVQFLRLIKIISTTQMHQHPKGRVKIDLDPPHEEFVIVSVEIAKAFKTWLGQ